VCVCVCVCVCVRACVCIYREYAIPINICIYIGTKIIVDCNLIAARAYLKRAYAKFACFTILLIQRNIFILFICKDRVVHDFIDPAQ
jgi:hypothetical protein